jgi:ketosteroid isomerase-like protein
MVQLLAEDVAFHLPGAYMGGGDVCGIDELMQMGRKRGRPDSGPTVIDVIDVVANDYFALTFEKTRSSRGTRRIEQVVCGVWRFSGGRVVELWSHYEDQAAVDAFWAD